MASSSCSTTEMVTCAVRLRMRYARPCARGWKRFRVGPSSQHASFTISRDLRMPNCTLAFCPADMRAPRILSDALHGERCLG